MIDIKQIHENPELEKKKIKKKFKDKKFAAKHEEKE